MTKHKDKLSEPFDHHAYERDSQWLPQAIAVLLLVAACTLVYVAMSVIS